MSDETLRALERRAAAGELVAVPLLRARVRAGVLTPERAELAALCGHAVAREALGWRCTDPRGCLPPLPSCEVCVLNDPRHLAQRIARAQLGAVARASWLGAMETLRGLGLEGEDCSEERALWAMRLWLDRPSDKRAVAAMRLAEPGHSDEGSEWWARPAFFAFMLPPFMLLPPSEADPLPEPMVRSYASLLHGSWKASAEAFIDVPEPPIEGVTWESLRAPHLARVLGAVRSGLAAWALGA